MYPYSIKYILRFIENKNQHPLMLGLEDKIKLMLRLSVVCEKNELRAYFKCQNNFFEKHRQYLTS